jgi:uncharacterized OsmC-like protein
MAIEGRTFIKDSAMALSAPVTDTIEASGFPICFKVLQGEIRPGVLGLADSRDRFTVQARAMGGHQKEAVVTEGAGGSAWRMVSDEGAGLKGTDLAPFPLGFMAAGLQADLLSRLSQLATAEHIRLEHLQSDLTNHYAFEGSFFKGTGRGHAHPPRIVIRATTDASAERVRALVARAVAASPILAAWQAPLVNTFALYANGQRRGLPHLATSPAPDATDPLKAWRDVPRPLDAAPPVHSLIEKLGPAELTAGITPPSWQSGRVEIPIHGTCALEGEVARSTAWANLPGGSRFALQSASSQSNDHAPSGLAYAFAGVAFCLMTQLLRYVEHHHMKIRALRIVQHADCEVTGGVARAHALDTHIFVHGEESEAVMERLVQMAADTCYLHAAFHSALESVVEVEVKARA